MYRILTPEEARSASGIGSKAARLAELAEAGFRVPRFVVITTGKHGEGHLPVIGDGSADEPGRRLAAALAGLGRGPFAVRSSAAAEDGTEDSHAGLYESHLDVAAGDVGSRIAQVWRSGRSERVRGYRHARGLDADHTAPAVLVQLMVAADAAGVAFAADPVSGRRDLAVVAATRGLGDRLVAGEVPGDSYRVDARGRVVARDPTEAGRPALSDRQARRIARLVRRVSDHYGRPQDIEWAIRGRRLYLLQARDITSLPPDPSARRYALWDNSNIVESYGGVTTPLTFSVARGAYADAYRQLGRAIGLSETIIASHAATYEQMIGLIEGRVYYNLLNWYRLLMLVPGFRYNARFMEEMMGVTRELPAEARPVPPPASAMRRLRGRVDLLRIGGRLLIRRFTHARRVRKFYRLIDAALEPAALESMSADQLIGYYERLQETVIPAWETPLINDLYCMVFHGALKRLCERWLPAELAASHNELVRGAKGLISMEPVRRMQEMAAIARRDPSLLAALTEKGDAACLASATTNPEFSRCHADYLARFGDRCVDELKLESTTLADNPLPLLRAVGLLAGRDGPEASKADGVTARARAERRVFDALRRRPLRRCLLRLILELARTALRDRENLRFERTRVYGRVRRIAVELGARLEGHDVIDRAADVFYLEIGEIVAFVHGTGAGAALDRTAAARRRAFERFRDGESPPRRFVTVGPPQLRGSRREDSDSEAEGLPGGAQGCSPGIARGRVRVVRDPHEAGLEAGDILVAERTDPGWVTLFPAASGLVMERGSLLSHTAIVARELGLPCIVGAVGACDRLRDGEWIEIDGTTGAIRRLDAAERAA